MSNLAASETFARHSILNFVNVTSVQTLKKLFNMKSRLLVLRSLKKPVPRLQLIDVSFHNSAEISWMSKTLEKNMKKQHPNACRTFNSTEHQESKLKTPQKPLRFLCTCSLKWWLPAHLFPFFGWVYSRADRPRVTPIIPLATF